MNERREPPLRVLEQLGEQLELAAIRERRRRAVPAPARIALVAAALLFVITGVAGAARALLEEGATLPPTSGGFRHAQHEPVVETVRLEPIRAHDPIGGPAWGIRTLRTRDGRWCATVGRVVNGRVGVVRGALFHALPLEAPGSCANLGPGSAAPAWSEYPGPNVDVRRARTVVYGMVGPDATIVTVVHRGVTRTLEPTGRGTFLTVVSGLGDQGGPPVTVRFRDGSAQTFDGSSRPETVTGNGYERGEREGR